jgi:hypothetical protein
MYPISAGIADTLSRTIRKSVPSGQTGVSTHVQDAQKATGEWLCAIESPAAMMMTVTVPAVVMAASATPSVMMTAAAMTAHMAMTVAMPALYLHERVAAFTGEHAGRNGRHRQRRRRRSEHCRGNEACLNETFHVWISSTAHRGAEHKYCAWLLFQVPDVPAKLNEESGTFEHAILFYESGFRNGTFAGHSRFLRQRTGHRFRDGGDRV